MVVAALCQGRDANIKLKEAFGWVITDNIQNSSSSAFNYEREINDNDWCVISKIYFCLHMFPILRISSGLSPHPPTLSRSLPLSPALKLPVGSVGMFTETCGNKHSLQLSKAQNGVKNTKVKLRALQVFSGGEASMTLGYAQVSCASSPNYTC